MTDDSNGERLRAALVRGVRGVPAYLDAARAPVLGCVIAEFFEWFKDRDIDLCEVKGGMHRNALGVFSSVYPCPMCTARGIVGDEPRVEAADA